MAAIEYACVDGVAEITLNRPEKKNAVSVAMLAELRERLDEAQRAGARALILTGAGGSFSAGRDLAGVDFEREDIGVFLREDLHPLLKRIMEFPAPSFAAVRGPCLGLGLGLAFACDVVYAADNAQLGSPFGRIGGVLDSGGHWHFMQAIGPHRTLELIYSGRLLSGREAADWGLVNRAVAGSEVLAEVRALARRVATGPTAAYVASKRIVLDMQIAPVGLDALLEAEAQAQSAAARSHDFREGVGAFNEKRAAKFTGS